MNPESSRGSVPAHVIDTIVDMVLRESKRRNLQFNWIFTIFISPKANQSYVGKKRKAKFRHHVWKTLESSSGPMPNPSLVQQPSTSAAVFKAEPTPPPAPPAVFQPEVPIFLNLETHKVVYTPSNCSQPLQKFLTSTQYWHMITVSKAADHVEWNI